ncbi:hypothetical protein RNP48_23620, partial [Escherichia coli]|nr:hypothetical protein [Escherichia coli]
MTRVVIALLFLAGCTSQMKYSNVVRIRNVCSSDINVFIPEYVFGGNVIKQHHIYLPVNGIDVLSYFYTENINDGFQGNDSNLLIVFYVQIMPDDFVMQLHR